jgi:signal peptidase I
MIARINKIWRENRSFVLFLSLMFIFRSAIADWNEVPTGSMKPTIIEGDRIFVNKMAYDIRVPFTHIPLLKLADPVRGDIIIFDSEKSDKRLVKRVVGVPHDVVEMLNNVVKINGKELSYRGLSQSGSTVDMLENLSGVEHKVRIRKMGSRLSSFKAVVVPENFYLALGDNRDNSADSRVIGMVPRNEIVGRSSSVVLSLNYDNYYIPRSGRFFETL